MKDYKYTSIDLFSGPGGLCTGFKWAGIKPLIAVEWSDWTIKTYAASHDADILDLSGYLKNPSGYKDFFLPSDKTLLIHGDIREVKKDLIKKILKERFDTDTVDIVSGGAPCESFSMAGDRKEEDYRNHLFLNIIRIAKEVDSKIIFFENVKGLFSKKIDGVPGKMYQAVCDEFEKKDKEGYGYNLVSRDKDKVLLLAADYGVPQKRERVFLVSLNNKYPDLKFSYPEHTHGDKTWKKHMTVADALYDLPVLSSGEESILYDYSLNIVKDDKILEFLEIMRGVRFHAPEHISFKPTFLSYHKSVNHRDNILKRMSLIKQGETMIDASERMKKNHTWEEFKEYFPKKLYAARNRRLDENQPSFTVTSHCLDEMIHPKEDRALTPREAARLQSFPDWYIFEGPYVKFHSDPEQDKYEQIGDAIPPLLAYNLGLELVKSLNTISSGDYNG